LTPLAFFVTMHVARMVEPGPTDMSLSRPLVDNALPERELVARIHAGDPAAFEELFKAYYSTLVTFVDAYVDRPTGEELVQELFLGIWRRHETWKPVGAVRAYLFAAARNQALSVLRKRRVASRTAEQFAAEGIALGAGECDRTPAQQLSAIEVQAACRRAIHELPESNRLVMMLRWDYGMSHAEIAFVIGTSIKGVEAELTRGLRTLARRLAWLHA
jgi:RNA polymerase sigma-70 factor, ECF subfamily